MSELENRPKQACHKVPSRLSLVARALQLPTPTMESIIEVQRQTHEEIERFERALATVLSKTQPTQQEKLANEHKASQILDRISSRVTTLHNLYQDEVSRKEEIDSISGARVDDLTEFYARVGKIKEYHTKYPDQVVGSFVLELAALVDHDAGEGADDEDGEEDRALLFSCMLTSCSLRNAQRSHSCSPGRRHMAVISTYTFTTRLTIT